MNELLQNMVNGILIPLIPALAVLLGLYIQKATEKVKAELKVQEGSIIAQRMDEATIAVIDAVQYTAQTYVDNMKGQNGLDIDVQKQAMAIAKEKALLLMSESAKQTANAVSGDLDKWLTTMVESKIKELASEPVVVESPETQLCVEEGKEPVEEVVRVRKNTDMEY